MPLVFSAQRIDPMLWLHGRAPLGPPVVVVGKRVCEHDAWANIAPKANRKEPICFSPHLYKARNLIERFFNNIQHYRRIASRSISSYKTTTEHQSSLPFAPGCAVVSLRPKRIVINGSIGRGLSSGHQKGAGRDTELRVIGRVLEFARRDPVTALVRGSLVPSPTGLASQWSSR